MFTSEQIAELKAPLVRSHVKKNPRGYDYVEGWHAIAEANRIFGFAQWDRLTLDMRQLGEPEKVDGKWRVAYHARVRILVRGTSERGEITRDGTGYGSGINKDIRDAHESALKEAETDAMKRALMTFGNPFGLALYDKDQSQVCDAPPPSPEQPQPPDESMLAYRDVAALAFEKATTVDELSQVWKEQVPQMRSLGFTGDNPIYLEIVEKFRACKVSLMEQEAKDEAA